LLARLTTCASFHVLAALRYCARIEMTGINGAPLCTLAGNFPALSESDGHGLRFARNSTDAWGKVVNKKAIYSGSLLRFAVFVALAAVRVPLALSEAKNEVGLVMGVTITPSQSLVQGSDLTFSPSLALGAEYDRQFWKAQRVAVYGGVDFLASPFDVKLDQRPPDEIRQYAYIFLTPHVRVKFRPEGPIAPWLSFGAGYARFLETQPGTPTVFKEGTNTGTLQFGAGVDTNTLVRVLRTPIGFRLEVRDFYSGVPSYNHPINADYQHNVVFTGGFLLRF
jgi:hypothetical protein